MTSRNARIGLAVALVLVLVGGILTVVLRAGGIGRTHVTGYFAIAPASTTATTSLFSVCTVGKVEKIEPQPDHVKITFWYNDKYKVPADAKAAILSPSLVTPRAIQLTPAYTGGPVMADHAVIPQGRTAVPVEWDDFRQQLEKLTQTLQPTQPGGISTLGALINTAADNLRGQGPDIRDTIIKLSQAISALGDHSNDLFSTVKNLSILVSALHDSSDLLQQLNQNLAAVTDLLANDPERGRKRGPQPQRRGRRRPKLRRRQPRCAGYHLGQVGVGVAGGGPEPRRHQASPAHRPDRCSRTF